jgi:hypothetical protein
MPRRRVYKPRRDDGYMSTLEALIGNALEDRGFDFEYEPLVIRFTQPAKKRRYTPDFILPTGIIVEVKGEFDTADRQKHLMVRDCHPDLDIRFVFSSSRRRIGKKSTTTYADWCRRHGFQYADKMIPQAWLKEGNNDASLFALERIRGGLE